VPRLSIAVLLLAAILAGCGGDDGNESAVADLKSRLLPVEEVPGFKRHRTFEWVNATDFVVQGVIFSENTKPSELIEVIADAGFEDAVGEELFKDRMGPGMKVLVARFASDSGARDAQDRLHQEDLTQPCYGACSQILSDLTVPKIPDAKGAQSVPDPNPPANAPPPFEGYAVEFTIGSYLYVVDGGGPPGAGMKPRVLQAAQALYDQVKNRED
jgi:hypothetical protein